MSKYSNNAGFRGYEEQIGKTTPDESENIKKSNIAPAKILIIMAIAVVTFTTVGVTALIISSGNGVSITGNTAPVKNDGQDTTYDMDFLFGTNKSAKEDSTLPLQVASSQQNSEVERTTLPKTTLQRADDSDEDDSEERSKSNNSSNNSNDTNNGGNYNNNSSNRSYNDNDGQSSRVTPAPSPSPKPQIIDVSSVSLNTSSMSMEIGDSRSLSATVSPGNATDKSITYKSSNSSVATVSSSGYVRAVGNGSATIIASSNNGCKASCSVTVEDNDNITLTPANSTISKGDTVTITLEGVGSDTYCNWDFSNPYVVAKQTTSRNYIKVRGVKAGTTNITTTYNGKTYKAKVTVVD